jgi:phenylalanyl-tRNA synthetase beta chain
MLVLFYTCDFGELRRFFDRIEPCKVAFPDGSTRISPDIAPCTITARASYINSCTSLSLAPSTIQSLLTRMTLSPALSPTDLDTLDVSIPCTRPNIFHEVDVMEDAAVVYGFDNLPDIFP